eukprot:543243_1
MVSNPSPGVYTFRSMHNKMITPVDIGTSEPQFEQHPMNYNSSTQQFEIQLSEDGDTYFIRSMETDQYWTVLSSTSLFDLTNGIGHLSLKPLQNGNEYQKFKFYPIERNKFHIESPVSGMNGDWTVATLSTLQHAHVDTILLYPIQTTFMCCWCCLY